MKPRHSIRTDINILEEQRERRGAIRIVREKHCKPVFYIALAHKLRFLVFALLLMTLIPPRIYGTLIIAKRTRAGELIVGADSQVANISKSRDLKICKIRKFGKFYFAISGLYEDRATGYDPYKIAEASMAAAKCDTIDCAAEALKRDIKGPFLTMLEASLKVDGLAMFTQWFVNGYPLDILVFGFHGGTTVIHQLLVRVKSATEPFKLDWEHSRCPGERCPLQEQFFAAGQTELAFEVVNNRQITQNADPSQLIHDWIAAVDRISDDVGPPYSVLRITPNGRVEWAYGWNGACEVAAPPRNRKW